MWVTGRNINESKSFDANRHLSDTVQLPDVTMVFVWDILTRLDSTIQPFNQPW